MKTYVIKNLFPCLGVASARSRTCLGVAVKRSRILPALLAGLGLILAGRVMAQTFTTLYSFTATDPNTYANSDGAGPSGLLLSGNTLFGITASGGSTGVGTVFAVNADGTGFTSLHSFTPLSDLYYLGGANSDGANPSAGLILSGNTLYGTALWGGSSGNGTVFSLSFRPQLTITPSGPNVILSWPANVAGFDYTGYTLQSAPALTGTFTNLPAATSPSTNPITGPQQFFRLISK